VWLGVCSVEVQNNIERIQNYCTRLILDRPPCTLSQELRDMLKWDTSWNRKRRFRLQVVYRCVHKYAPEYMNNRLNTNVSLGCPCTRGYSKLNLNGHDVTTTNDHLNTLGSKDWNSLPDSIRALKSSKAFKLAIKQQCWLFSVSVTLV